ncbi:hypothetical protein LTS14_006532 [Recurvomyces mirabilis]|uniref:uncharacterized protein n=1 Tax=Recurvomyces mirabilis TaxID=574656 RepID=UPI002DDDCDD9|nr:hypothetical protein LTS14_006532 [Recurvomyces mirabilis]
MDTKADIVVDARDVDEAFYAVKHQKEVGETTNVDEKRLLRRIDLKLMPLMFMCYFLQYSDKTLINYAAVMGLIEDTNMPDNGFSHLAIAFYCSFLFFEPIQAFCLQRFPIAKWLGANVICWGIVLCMNCVARSYAPLVVLRVLLGVFESATAPSLNLMTTMWYKRHEQTLRTGYWYQGTSIGPAVSSLIAYGFVHWAASSPDANFKPWQVLFLLYGLITIVTGILVLLFLPDNPMKSRFSHDEKIVAVERLRENQTGIENKHFKWAQFRETLADPRTWILSMIVVSTNIPNGAVSSFSSIIIENFGYNQYQTLLLNLPSAAVAFVAVLLGTWWAGRYNARGIAIIALVTPTIIGGALMAWLPPDNKAGLLIGNYLTNTVGASLPLMYSWIGANYSGHTKKVTMNAIVLMSFCVGNVIGPETFQAKSAPAYIPAKITIVAVLSVAILLVLLLDYLIIRENKKRDQAGLVDMPANYEFMDLTDKENRNFRYLL